MEAGGVYECVMEPMMESGLNAVVYGAGKCNENGSPFENKDLIIQEEILKKLVISSISDFNLFSIRTDVNGVQEKDEERSLWQEFNPAQFGLVCYKKRK